MSEKEKDTKKKEYNFGGVKEYSLEEIEKEVLNDSVYLDVFAGSDFAYKKEIENLDDNLGQINKLNPVQYNYKADEFPQKNFSDTKQFGFIAQEVEAIFPNLVRKDSNELLEMNYMQLIPILVGSIKEMSSKIEELENKIKKLEK